MRIRRLTMMLIGVALVAAGAAPPHVRADDRASVESSSTVDTLYKDALSLYRQERYDKALERLNHILVLFNEDAALEAWRKDRDLMPTKQDVVRMLDDVNGAAAQDAQRERAILREQELHKETMRKRQQEEQLAEIKRRQEEQLAEAKRRQDEQMRKDAVQTSRQEALKLQKAEKQRQEEAQQKQRLEESKAREEALLKQKAERMRREQALQQQRESEQKERQVAMTQEREQTVQKDTLVKIENDMLKKTREQELAKAREEAAKQGDEARIRKEAQRRAREEELARQKAEALKAKELLKAQASAQRQAREEELARQKAESLKAKELLKAQALAQRQAHEQELAKQTVENLKAKELLKAQSLAAAQRNAYEEELAKQKAETLKAKELLRAQELAQRQAREEDVQKKKEDALKQREVLLEQKETDTRAKEALLVRQREDIQRQEEQIFLQKELDRKRATAAQEAQKAALAREQKAKLQENLVIARRPEADEAIISKNNGLKIASPSSGVRNDDVGAVPQNAGVGAVREPPLQGRGDRAPTDDAREKVVDKAVVSNAQVSALSDAEVKQKKSQKEEHDREKIARADYLWKEARRLYNIGMYKESIKLFREIVAIEGNPRIKYTPDALKYIRQAQEKAIEQDDARRAAADRTEIGHVENEMLQKVAESQILPYIDPPKKVEESRAGSLIEPSPLRKKLIDQKITMDFDKVSLKSVIQFLSQESGINIVSSQKVLNLDPAVTARFNNTPLFDVVKYITKSLGLVYRIDKDVVWIADPEEIANEAMETRVYYLLKGGGLFTDFTPVSAGNTGLGGSSAQINKVYTIEDTLKEVVQWPGDAKLTYDKRLNALIVRNTPQNLQMLEDMLYTLDIDPCQILIEAKFIEVDITNEKDFGLEWKLNSDSPVTSKKNGSTATAVSTDSGFNFSDFLRPTEGFNLGYKGVLTTPQFQVVLHALEESKKIKTLSSPRITTLNSQMASIKVVDEWIYPTRYEYEIVQFDLNGDGDYNDAGETTYKNVPKDFQRRDVGIILKVIPTVGADRKSINLSLIPEVSEAEADAFVYTGDVKLPKFTSRNLATTIVVNNGETVVLGGLVKENRTHTVQKVPLLGDLPGLGKLFKKDEDTIQRKNLIIFVTAKVLSPSGEEIVITKK